MSAKKNVSKLGAAYAAYLRAYSAVENMDAGNVKTTAQCNALIDAEAAAIWQVISAPICNDADVAALAKFLSALHLDEIESEFADGRFQAALAKLIAHLCRV